MKAKALVVLAVVEVRASGTRKRGTKKNDN